jgi:hypothetical protein
MKKLTKEELLEVVTKLYNVDYDTEEEGDELMDLFKENIPYQDIIYELMYSKQNEHLTPEEIVEKALAYKPVIIELGGPKYSEAELQRKDKKRKLKFVEER